MISIACPCGKKLQAREESAGRQVKCPGCGTLLTVPSLSSNKPASVQRPAGGMPAGSAGFDADTERKSGSGCLFWLFAVLLLSCMCSTGGVVGWFGMSFFGPSLGIAGGPKAPLDYVPADATAFVAVKVAEGWKSPTVQKLVGSQQGFDQGLKELQEKAGLKPEDIEWTVVATFDPLDVENVAPNLDKNSDAWILIQSSKDFDKDKILNELSPAREEKKHNGKSYFVGDPQKMKDGNIHFINAKQAVFASNKGILRFLDQGKVTKTGPLSTAIAAAKNKMFTASGQVSADARDRIRKLIAATPVLKPAEPLAEVESAYATVHESGDNVQVKVVLSFPDEKKAKAAQQAGDAGLVLAKTFLPVLLATAPPDLVKTANAVLGNTKIEQQASEVHVSTEVESSAVIGFLEFANKKGR